jgi:hypothetical protein
MEFFTFFLKYMGKMVGAGTGAGAGAAQKWTGSATQYIIVVDISIATDRNIEESRGKSGKGVKCSVMFLAQEIFEICC